MITGFNNNVPSMSSIQIDKESGHTKKYDAYFIENKQGEKFPENCYGAIGITLDDKVIGYKHVGLKVFSQISSFKNDIDSIDSYHSIDLTNVMHGFVVTSRMKPTSLNVCEAIGEGFVSAEIKIGDWDWTSMVLFVPKEERLADRVVINAMQELKSDQKGCVANYGYLEGIESVFTKKTSSKSHASIVVSEMADLIKFRSIRNRNGEPKDCICSQLAMRILRASLLMALIPEEKLQKYQNLTMYALKRKLTRKISKPNSPLNKAYQSSTLFNVQPDVDTLPYELYLALKKESDLH